MSSQVENIAGAIRGLIAWVLRGIQAGKLEERARLHILAPPNSGELRALVSAGVRHPHALHWLYGGITDRGDI